VLVDNWILQISHGFIL